MTSLERAKRFIAQKGPAITMSIVPLAGLMLTPQSSFATPQAGFTVGSCGISAIGNGVSLSGGCTETSDGLDSTSGLIGVKLLGSGGDPAVSSLVSGGFYGVDVLGSGQANINNFTGTIPVIWDFTPTASNQGTLSYQLTFTLFGGFAQDLNGGTLNQGGQTRIESGTVASGTLVSGTDAFTLSGFNTSSYSIDLQVTQTIPCCSQGSLSVHIPTNSLDLAETVTTATPEPASLLLFGTGLLGLLSRRFRRSKQ